jgi:hypothetical protein
LGFKERPSGGTPVENHVPSEIAKQLWRWNSIAALHRVTYVILGLVGALFPLLVASFADSLDKWQVRSLSFAASAAIALFAAFDVGNLATRWREAWKHLNTARVEYELGIIGVDGLAKAYREGEAIIGKMESNPFAKVKNAERDHDAHEPSLAVKSKSTHRNSVEDS